MTDTKRFTQPEKKPIDWYTTKYDGFKLVRQGDYKHQKGSGRSACFELAKDGMIVATWTKKCAEAGYEPIFAVNCVQKLSKAKEPGWVFSETNNEGLTYAEVLGSRTLESAKEKKEGKVVKSSKAGQKTTKRPRNKKKDEPEAAETEETGNM